MTTLTRQDVQSVVDQARGRLIDYVPSRQDVQVLQDAVKTLINISNQNQSLLRQEEGQYTQMVRRVGALESRLILLEREIQQLHRTLTYVADHQPTERLVVARSGEQQYLYTAV